MLCTAALWGASSTTRRLAALKAVLLCVLSLTRLILQAQEASAAAAIASPKAALALWQLYLRAMNARAHQVQLLEGDPLPDVVSLIWL